MRIAKIFIPIMIFTFLMFGFLPLRAESTNRIVAIVNDEIITLYELEKAEKSYKLPTQEKQGEEEFQKQLLFHLIDQKLVDIQIKKMGIQISPEEVDKAIARIKEEQGIKSAEDFNRVLLREGYSESEFRNKIKEQILRFRLIGREIGNKIIIPESQIRDYYEKNPAQFKKANGMQLAIILLTVPENATAEEWAKQKTKIEDIRNRLLKGEKFEDAARQYSQDPSATQGGNLGLIGSEEIDPTLRNVLSSLNPGEISPVLQAPNGWQIIKLIDLKGAKEISYEEAKEQIHERLFQAEVDKRFMEWLKKLKDRSYIQVLL